MPRSPARSLSATTYVRIRHRPPRARTAPPSRRRARRCDRRRIRVPRSRGSRAGSADRRVASSRATRTRTPTPLACRTRSSRPDRRRAAPGARGLRACAGARASCDTGPPRPKPRTHDHPAALPARRDPRCRRPPRRARGCGQSARASYPRASAPPPSYRPPALVPRRAPAGRPSSARPARRPTQSPAARERV